MLIWHDEITPETPERDEKTPLGWNWKVPLKKIEVGHSSLLALKVQNLSRCLSYSCSI